MFFISLEQASYLASMHSEKKSLSGNWVGAKVPNTHKNPAVGASLILDKHSCQLRSTTYLNQPIKDHQDVGPHSSWCIHYK